MQYKILVDLLSFSLEIYGEKLEKKHSKIYKNYGRTNYQHAISNINIICKKCN